MNGRHWALVFGGCCSNSSWRCKRFQVSICKFRVFSVLLALLIRDPLMFQLDKLLMKKVYVFLNAAIQIFCKSDDYTDFVHLLLAYTHFGFHFPGIKLAKHTVLKAKSFYKLVVINRFHWTKFTWKQKKTLDFGGCGCCWMENGCRLDVIWLFCSR